MPRPKLSEKDKKMKLLITIDKSIYDYSKSKNVKLSPLINHLLHTAFILSSENMTSEPKTQNSLPSADNLRLGPPLLHLMSDIKIGSSPGNRHKTDAQPKRL